MTNDPLFTATVVIGDLDTGSAKEAAIAALRWLREASDVHIAVRAAGSDPVVVRVTAEYQATVREEKP